MARQARPGKAGPGKAWPGTAWHGEARPGTAWRGRLGEGKTVTLTRPQRKALFAGDCPKLTYPGDVPCPVAIGHVEVLSAHVRLEVTGIRRTRKGEWVLDYTLWDQRRERDRYLQPAAFHSVPMAQDGRPKPMSAEEELGYTTNPRLAMEPGVPSVSLADQTVLDMAARNRFAEQREAERSQELARRDMQRLNTEIRELVKRAAKMGVPTTQVLAPIAREVSAQHATLKDAA